MINWDELSEPELVELTTSDSLDRKGKALEELGRRAASRGNLRLAKAYCEESVQVNDEADNLEWATTSRQMLGRINIDLGDPSSALAPLTEAESGFQSLLWDRVLAETLRLRAQAYQKLDAIDSARGDYESAGTIFGELGAHPDLVSVLIDHAELEARHGQWWRVIELLEYAVDVSETTPDFDRRLSIHISLIEAHTMLEKPARELIDQARELGKLSSEQWHDTIIESWAARNLLATGFLDEAQTVIDTMDRTLASSDGKRHRVAILRSLLAEAISGGSTVGDVEALKTAFLLGTSYEDPDWLPESTRLLAYHYSTEGDHHTALHYVQKSLGHFSDSFPPVVVSELIILETEILAAMGRWEVVAERLQTIVLHHTADYVHQFARLLKLAINHNLRVKAPRGEIIVRLQALTARSWRLAELTTPTESDTEGDGVHSPTVPVSRWLRAWGFERAANSDEFEAQKIDLLTRVSILRSGIDDLPDPEPLGQDEYAIDHRLYAPYIPESEFAYMDLPQVYATDSEEDDGDDD